jgi:hypothetical protein
MIDLDDAADRLNRTVKIALDSGEASSIEEAELIFRAYRLQIVVGRDVAHNPGLQAALLTAVNCASRTLLGGVTVVGAAGPLCVACRPFETLEEAVVGLGARCGDSINAATPTVVIGETEELELEPLAVRATFHEWCGGAVPLSSHVRLSERGSFTTSGVLAGAIAISEIFLRLRGGAPMACRRAVGLDLWRPDRDWVRGEPGGALDRLPSAAWLVGLGNLGQAYLWTLGLLPYGSVAPALMLQDTDVLAPSNISTSLLTTPALLGQRKTRAMAAWAEARGFSTSIVERRFAADFRVGSREPSVALIGVDNASARQAIEDVGFERVIEAGLGRGPGDFLGIDLHTFPADQAAAAVWRDSGPAGEADPTQPAYAALLKQTGDRCGTVRLAGRSIGAPFVGSVAAALVVAELVRLAVGGSRHEMISCHLRDLGGRSVIAGEPWPACNPGTIPLAS